MEYNKYACQLNSVNFLLVFHMSSSSEESFDIPARIFTLVKRKKKQKLHFLLPKLFSKMLYISEYARACMSRINDTFQSLTRRAHLNIKAKMLQNHSSNQSNSMEMYRNELINHIQSSGKRIISLFFFKNVAYEKVWPKLKPKLQNDKKVTLWQSFIVIISTRNAKYIHITLTLMASHYVRMSTHAND